MMMMCLEIGGASVYEIDGAGTKWAPVKGTVKYNKDAFIVIKTNLVTHMSHLKNPTVPILMFLGVILATLSVIVAGYFHGKMNIGAVWHNLHNFS